jgi:hypothetical protein
LAAFIGATLPSFLRANAAAVTLGSPDKSMAACSQVRKVGTDVSHLPAISLYYASWDIDDVHLLHDLALAPNKSMPLSNPKLQFPWA